MTTTNPAAYDDFAWIYDRHWGPDVAWMLEAIHPLVLRDVPAPARVLDLCCGTGQMARALHDRGYSVTGVDGSPRMIHHARQNALECTFVVADARDFSVPAPHDVALALYDPLNHLLEPGDLRRAFGAVHAALRPGAPFLFDLNMAEGYRARWRGSYGVAEDEYACVIRSRYDEPSASAELAATVFRRGETEWVRSDVVLHQRCYAQDEVTETLAAAGFSNVRVFDAARDLGLRRQVGRGFFLAVA
jgi:SAM-dependent methyltransferase